LQALQITNSAAKFAKPRRKAESTTTFWRTNAIEANHIADKIVNGLIVSKRFDRAW
jgi:hypothetical protein